MGRSRRPDCKSPVSGPAHRRLPRDAKRRAAQCELRRWRAALLAVHAGATVPKAAADAEISESKLQYRVWAWGGVGALRRMTPRALRGVALHVSPGVAARARQCASTRAARKYASDPPPPPTQIRAAAHDYGASPITIRMRDYARGLRDPGGLTAALMGDPPPGRSALDQRRKAEGAA